MRGRAKPITDHLGQWWPNEKACAKAWGISVHTMRARLAEGRTMQAALTDPRMDRGPCRRVPTSVNGVVYASRKDAAAAVGLSSPGLRWHLNRGREMVMRQRKPSTRLAREAKVAAILDAWRASYYGRGAA